MKAGCCNLPPRVLGLMVGFILLPHCLRGQNASDQRAQVTEDRASDQSPMREAQKREAQKREAQKREAQRIRSDDPRAAVPGYLSRAVEGWPVRVSEALVKSHPEATERALELLGEQLRTVKRLLPESAVSRLIDVPIWFSPKYDGFGPTGEYHPGADWLARQGRHPKLHRCVEFTNIPKFEHEVERMPVLVIHELAHAYHDQVLGFDNAEIRATFEVAKHSGRYDAVERGNGKTERAYAMTNDREYFAETSEAYFGRNDFYPFDRSELEMHDPRMATLLKELWDDH
ncbi:hypothetical protein [Stieleria mannarensis]|uniref:hypothetical protein n=1 Tax=Stieleria mannarensis TaxID=2755585 RepID=UPI0016023461|nr:hypothetical protein [Rhodopirellula sp. JC639]